MNELQLFCKKNGIALEIVYNASCDSIDLKIGTLQDHQYELVVLVQGTNVDYRHILDSVKQKLKGACI